jgi:hypothetical protein
MSPPSTEENHSGDGSSSASNAQGSDRRRRTASDHILKLFERPEFSKANSNLRMSMLHWASDPDLRGDELIQAIKEEFADPHALLSDRNLNRNEDVW